MISFFSMELLAIPNPAPEKSFGKVMLNSENIGCKTTAGALLIVPPHGFVPMHYHKSREVWLFMLSGEVKQIIGAKSFMLKPGDFVFIAPNAAHGSKNGATEEARFVEIWTTPEIDPDFYLVDSE